MARPDEDVRCRKCGEPIDGDGFGSPETGWEHPFVCPKDEPPADIGRNMTPTQGEQ